MDTFGCTLPPSPPYTSKTARSRERAVGLKLA